MWTKLGSCDSVIISSVAHTSHVNLVHCIYCEVDTKGFEMKTVFRLSNSEDNIAGVLVMFYLPFILRFINDNVM
jgi:hypothetical protein